MECNRDEALRSKSIAEDKLEKKDFAGAKKFAMKAQTLYPGLDGISQILTILEVYISAENKVSGETDWYGVLGVNPSDDDEIIRKQYRKLALMLHPDKNKSVGADGAFKLISEAWSLLSDKTKRLQYNQRRGSRGFQQKVQMHSGGNMGAAAAPRANGIFNFASRMPSVPKTQNNTAKQPPPKPKPKPKPTPTPTPSSLRNDTFWTICHRCKMHYEYLKMYLNHTLLCPNCREAFMASETAPPIKYSKTPGQIPRQQQNTSSTHPSRPAYENVTVSHKPGASPAPSTSVRRPQYKQNPHSGTTTAASTDPSIAAKAANVVQLAQDKLKRTYTESHASAGWERTQKRKLDDDNSRYGMNYNVAQGNGGMGSTSGSAQGSRFYGFPGTYRQPNSSRDLTPQETRKMLIVKARKELLNKLESWRSESKESKKDKHRSTGNIHGRDQNGNDDFTAAKLTVQPVKKVQEDLSDDIPEEHVGASINVPDPDFHDFDQDRTESSFGDNEVWSAYDDDDGMPRFYALISKVISRNPFKLKLSWLNSKTNSEFSTLDWVGSGFYKTCGEFRIGRHETCKSINAFSQKVNWSKGPRGTILIVPQKGDVWALYKNWSSKWNEHTPDEVIHKYDMVTVLDNYSEEQGVRVAPLMKVVGFKTVFRPNMDPEAIKSIPKEEMFRFSHRVPNHLLTGAEAPKAPKGYLELDPAATPLELLQVTTKDDEVPMADGRN